MSKLSMVQMNFDQAYVQRIVKDRRNTVADKISSVGGTLGLFTGFSILSIFEAVYWLYKGMGRLRCLKKCSRRRRSQKK